MKTTTTILLAARILFAVTLWSQSNDPLELVNTIPVPALHDGDFDHFALDLPGHRLFLAAEENAVIEVFDARSNKLIHTITDVQTPHSMVYRADLKKLATFVSGESLRDDMVRTFGVVLSEEQLRPFDVGRRDCAPAIVRTPVVTIPKSVPRPWGDRHRI